MVYLRWSGSPWYAFSHLDGGDGDDALLVAWHERGAGATVAAGELLGAGCEGRPERLRDFMEARFRAEAAGKPAAMKNIDVLAPAVDQFLFEVYNAGKIAMPPEVAHRYRELKRWIDEALADPHGKYPVDGRGVSMLFTWSVELEEIRRRYPSPRVSRKIRDLIQARALRALAGQSVSAAQDALERAQIAAASQWPLL